MFDAGSGGSDTGTFDSGSEGTPERRQYTLKGVEADTIRLMRHAANREGMKIGSWVSVRMREAAERALAQGRNAADSSPNLQRPTVAIETQLQESTEVKEALEARLNRIEHELQELISGQRNIMSALLANICR